MKKKNIIKLDGSVLEADTIKRLAKSKDVVCLKYWGGDSCDLILKDGTIVTVYIKEG